MDQNETEPPFPACGATGSPAGPQHTCTRPRGHAGHHMHPAHHPDGIAYSWSQDAEPKADRPKIRIESEGTTGSATRVLIDGRDITNLVTAVTWHLGVGEGPATATVTFLHVDIAADAQFTYTPEDWERLREFAPNLTEAIENGSPVEGRAKIVPHGELFAPIAMDGGAVAKLLPDEQQGV